MIRFNPIGDGNCLYYSLMFRLAVDWLNGDLKQDQNTIQQVADLFLELDKIYPNLEIKEKLSDDITPKSIDEIFQTIMAICQNDSGKVDWKTYQRLTGAAARNFTINKIRRDKSIQDALKVSFRVALSRTVDAYEGATESKNIFYPDALNGIVSIKHKINDTILNDKHKPVALRSFELIHWFEHGTDDGASGFDLWLDHAMNDKMFAGNLEFHVFTQSLGVPGQYRTLDDVPGTFHLASEPEEIIAGLNLKDSYTLLLNLSRSGHWEVYLENDAKAINLEIANGDVSHSYQFSKSTMPSLESSSTSDFNISNDEKQTAPLIFSTLTNTVLERFDSDKEKSLIFMALSTDSHFYRWVKQAHDKNHDDVINVLLKLDNNFFNALAMAAKPDGIFGVGAGSSRRPGLIDLPASGLERFFRSKNMISAVDSTIKLSSSQPKIAFTM